MPALQWSSDWRTTLLVVVLLPILLALGFWQLSRAAEKAELAAQFAQREAAAPLSLEELLSAGTLQPEQMAFRRVEVQGVYQAGEDVLLDNRIRSGRFGYEVVTPLLFAGGVVMVNRGWLAGDRDRRQLPEVPTPVETVTLTGYLHVPSKAPYRLGEEILPAAGVAVMQHLDMALLRERYGAALFPHELRLDAAAPSAFDAQWSVINQSPAKHRGYAFQWFAMAAVLCGLFVYRSLRRPERALPGENVPHD